MTASHGYQPPAAEQLGFSSLCALSLYLCSQAPVEPASIKSVAEARSPEDSYSNEPDVFDLIESRARFEADGKGRRDLTKRVRIQSESAVHEFGLPTYSFASSFESLDVDYVRVRKSDGSVVETPPSDIQEVDSPVSREAPRYTDQREKHIAVKSLTIGDTLEAHLRREQSSRATFIICFTNGDKLPKVVFLSGSQELRKAASALARAKYVQSFPDDTPAQIIRRADLNCSIYSKECTMMIATVTEAAAPPPISFPIQVVPKPKTSSDPR